VCVAATLGRGRYDGAIIDQVNPQIPACLMRSLCADGLAKRLVVVMEDRRVTLQHVQEADAVVAVRDLRWRLEKNVAGSFVGAEGDV